MDSGRIRSSIAACMVLVAVASCQWPGASEPAALPTRVPAEIGPGTSVDRTLALMEAQLDTVLATGLDDNGPVHLDRAEAISNRLLETRLPFAWISAESYSLEARLRQIQATSDRIGALWAGGARGEPVLAEVRGLRTAVAELRADIEAGGSAAPPPVGQLLTGLDTVRRR